MSDHNLQSRFSLRTPAMVDIMVAGYLDESWAAQLGMDLDHPATNALSVTVLKGMLIDQAALFGVLNGLYGLGYPLLSVECTPVYLEFKLPRRNDPSNDKNVIKLKESF